MLITPFSSKNTSLAVAVYCHAVKGAALFPFSPLAQRLNVKSVQSVLQALLGTHWSGVFELAAQPILKASTQTCSPACTYRSSGACH